MLKLNLDTKQYVLQTYGLRVRNPILHFCSGHRDKVIGKNIKKGCEQRIVFWVHHVLCNIWRFLDQTK